MNPWPRSRQARHPHRSWLFRRLYRRDHRVERRISSRSRAGETMNDLVIMSKCITGNGGISRQTRDFITTHSVKCYGGNRNHLLRKSQCSRCQLRSTPSHEGFHPHFHQSPNIASILRNSSYWQSTCGNCECWPPFYIHWSIGTLTNHIPSGG
jgi:hypothetical protein